MAKQRIDLENDNVVFRRVHGRIVPIRVGTGARIKEGLTGSLAPAALAAVLGEGLSVGAKSVKEGRKLFSLTNLVNFANPTTFKSMGKVAALTVGFSVGYNLLFGKRQRNVIELDKKVKAQPRARIWLASKPGLTGTGHDLGEHSYLYVRDNHGKTTTYGGQIKNLSRYGKSGVRLTKNFVGDKVTFAQNIHDLTPHTSRERDKAIAAVHRHADTLRAQLKNKDYQYRMYPVQKNTYNSNSVTGTLVRRSNLQFKYHPSQHNLPGFNRTIRE